MKKALFFILPLLIVGLFYSLDKTTKRVKVPFNIDKALKEKATKEYLEENIKKELTKNELEEAQALVDIASYLKVDINHSLINTLEDKKSSIDRFFKKSGDFFSGFFSGKVHNSASLAGSVSSDFTIVGDVRDIYKEGSKYLNNESYNRFILSLSLLGVGLSITTLSSFGASAPLKVATSTLKSAKRSRYLNPKFTLVLEKKLQKSVDLKTLKKIDLSSFKGIKNSRKIIAKSIHLKPIKSTFKNIAAIKKNTSTIDTLKILRYIDSEKELQKALKVTQKYKKNSYGVFKVLGKKTFKGAKFIIKKTTLYFFTLFSLIISALFWIIVVFYIIFSFIKK